MDVRGDRVRVVAALRTLGVALTRQVDRDDVEPVGEAGHDFSPCPPGLRESGEQDDGRAGRPAAFDGMKADAVGVNPAVSESRQVVQGQIGDRVTFADVPSAGRRVSHGDPPSVLGVLVRSFARGSGPRRSAAAGSGRRAARRPEPDGLTREAQ
ncbi:hypothetical protein GCM10017744_037170 [Streptomyces antimycoticus]|uniref:Uncharacterized protein n=1 Tax=Streptomyces antimycoticus TaxID=68175 RepID=A0A4D4KIF6_9ACTN|nr:hypothetical protein SANT12839_065450 [Streptomyces antimycoticus]